MTGEARNDQLLDDAITQANDLVIGASMTIMDRESTPHEQTQGRYFQSLFTAVRDVLQQAKDGRDPSRSTTTMALARAVVGADVAEELTR